MRARKWRAGEFDMSNKNLKERIRSGELLIGVSVPLNASREDMERIIEQDDYAFVYTDSQHGPFNEETLVELCRHAATFDIPVQFRIKHTSHSYLIGNLLDLGPVGIDCLLYTSPSPRDRG